MTVVPEKPDSEKTNCSGNEDDDWLSNIPHDLKPFFLNLNEGFFKPLDFGALSQEKPNWIDAEKLEKGQKFARKHRFSLSLVAMVSLLIVFAENLVKKSFIYFGKANTPFKIFQRQVRIGSDIASCYEADIWGTEGDSAKKRFEKVLNLHNHYDKQLRSHSTEQIDEKVSSYKIHELDGALSIYKIIRDDFKNSCGDIRLYSKFNNRSTNLLLSQSNFMLVQLTFMGLALNNPRYFGIYWTSDEEWEGFVHVWRIIGHLLGINDEYNVCNADLDTVRRRTKILIDLWAQPALADVDVSWEFMCRCTVDGVKLMAPLPILNFESVFLFLSSSIGVEVRGFKEKIGFWKYLCYLLMRFLACCHIIPGVPMLCNFIIKKLMDRANNTL